MACRVCGSTQALGCDFSFALLAIVALWHGAVAGRRYDATFAKRCRSCLFAPRSLSDLRFVTRLVRLHGRVPNQNCLGLV